jgi:hypothetical protein
VRVNDVVFSPNRVEFNVFGGSKPGRVMLNTNWAPGWSSTAGPIELLGEPGKLAAIMIPPGFTGRHAFTFTPPGLTDGTLVMFSGVIVSALLWRRRTKPIFSVPVPPPR